MTVSSLVVVIMTVASAGSKVGAMRRSRRNDIRPTSLMAKFRSRVRTGLAIPIP
jgi:hypothetical protein